MSFIGLWNIHNLAYTYGAAAAVTRFRRRGGMTVPVRCGEQGRAPACSARPPSTVTHHCGKMRDPASASVDDDQAIRSAQSPGRRCYIGLWWTTGCRRTRGAHILRWPVLWFLHVAAEDADAKTSATMVTMIIERMGNSLLG
jgi:hypothetical protein